MDKKKIIGIVVFIILGLVIFTFANPAPSTLDPVDEPGQEDKQPDKDEQQEEDKESEQEEEDSETVGNIQDEEQDESVVDYYQLALEAIIKAEGSLVQDDIDAAKDLINNVNEDLKEDLVNRVENVQNIVDYNKLLTELENKVNSSTNKDELNSARDYNTTNELANKLASLNDDANKTNLLNRYNVLLPKLNDTTAPVVSGVLNDSYVNDLVSLTISDDANFIATLNGENYITGTEIKEDGVYTLVVVDSSFNETVVTFTIDTTASTVDFDKLENGYTNNGNITIKDNNEFNIVIKVNGEEKHSIQSIEKADGTHYRRNDISWLGDGEYEVIVTDKAGNVTTKTFTIDKTAPTITLDKSVNELNFTNNGNVTIEDENSFDVVVKINGEEKHKYSGESFKRADLSWLGDGEYEIIVTDKAGNTTTISFILDKTAPTIDFDKLENGYTNNGNITVKDNNEFNIVIKVNGEEKHSIQSIEKADGTHYRRNDISWLGDGEYEVIVTDKAGNVTTKTFAIDKTAPKTSAANILINGDSNNDKVFYGTYGDKIYTYVRFNEELKQIPTFKLINNGKEYVIAEKDITIRKNDKGEYQYSAYVELTEELGMTDGEITMFVSNIEDKAGNKIADITKPTNGHIVYLDTNPAGRVYSTLDFDGTGIVPEIDGTRKTYYIKNGSSFVFRIHFTEQLLENPILNVGDKQVELELVDKYVTEEGKYIYQGTVEINAEDKFKDGILVLILSNVKDLAGNETTGIEVLDQTVTSNDRTAFVDNTAPKISSLSITGGTRNKDDNTYYANAEDYVYVYAVFNEKLNVVPTLKIEGKEYIMDSLHENNGTYRYYSREVKAENLEEGLVNFEVYGYKDIAGNEGKKLENKDITLSSQSKVIVDTIAPIISISGTEGLNKNEYRIESGTQISLEDMLAIANDASFGGEIKIEPKRVDFLAPGSVIEDNIYNYDYKANCFDTRKVGRYNIYYQATDKAGNVSEEKLMMLVMTDTTAPVVTINVKTDIYVEFGSKYNELGATMTDNVDETITDLRPTTIVLYDLNGNHIKDVTTTGVDTNVEGRYLLYYDYVDGAGNSSQTDNGYTPYSAKRWVIVENTKDSVIEND